MERKLPWLDASISWEENLINEIFGYHKYFKLYLSEMGKVYLQGAISTLPFDERAVIVKYFEGGLSQREIAEYLEISSDEVYFLYVKSLRRLRHPCCSKGLVPHISKHFNISRNPRGLGLNSKFRKNNIPQLKKND